MEVMIIFLSFGMHLLGAASFFIQAHGQRIASQDQLRDPRGPNARNGTLSVPDDIGTTVIQSTLNPPPDYREESYVGRCCLVNRRGLITGGDSGIGRAVAIAFAREVAAVTISYLPDERADTDNVRPVIESTADSQVFANPGDIRNASFCEKQIDEAAEQMGGPDILVNKAGWADTTATNITNVGDENFQRAIDTNIFAPFYLTRAAVPDMPLGSREFRFLMSSMIKQYHHNGCWSFLRQQENHVRQVSAHVRQTSAHVSQT